MNKRQKEQQFRTEIAKKIADIQDTKCEPCDFNKRQNKSASLCGGCEHGKKLKEYGDLLLSVDIKESYDGRHLYQLSLEELQKLFRVVGKYE
ncbi:zinc-finger domain-containing protein [Bacillus sp. FJAT-45037]|uniref:zinc-finger domain-containing protein n=1 Tax=Bacillus sp. FJAT-45037 TaxID=2011007 RepID=UPI000C24FE7E|nr:zinc-finger domain-containing protein [Bacillus sp. FJAT-45037]